MTDGLRELRRALDLLMERKSRAVVGIDGDCASGKTTLASLLSKQYGAGIIHMDDFFLRPEQRTPQRYGEPGGNVDYERFAQEVAPMLLEGRRISYRSFDCKAMKPGNEIVVLPGPLTIVEGAYSLHPKIGFPYDLRIFLTAGEREQRERIILRNGAQAYEMFRQTWIPYEKKYFAAFLIMESSDLILGPENLSGLKP